ncbi:MAG: hypothetical protein JJ979_15655, partial [Roseibium sp.]|nr:hypothetical protein [Roseibium sp.]
MSGLNAAIEAIQQRNSAAPLPSAPRAVLLGKTDDVPEAPTGTGRAEGQSFMIEYRSETGEATARRITVFSIQEDTNGIPVLIARCHECNAERAFRADRVKCCID